MSSGLLPSGTKKPQLWIIAGPNGAGKSSLVRVYLKDRIPYINPDDYGPLLVPENSLIDAGRLAIHRRQACLAEGKDFAYETTLSGRIEAIRKVLREAVGGGFKTNLVYIGLESPMLALFRITVRVASGGHNVPRVDVARRYDSGLRNLIDVATAVDRLFLFDNSSKRRHLLLAREKGSIEYLTKREKPSWAVPIIDAETARHQINPLDRDRIANTTRPSKAPDPSGT